MQRQCAEANEKMSVEDMMALILAAPPGPWAHHKKKDNPREDDCPRCWAHWPNTKEAMRRLSTRFVQEEMPDYPGHFEGRGIVICGGGTRYFPSAWVAIKKLRHLNCKLPIQLWHLGEIEMDPHTKRILAPLGVECIDARKIEQQIPARILCGWELKMYAVAMCPFREVLSLDADCAPVRDPEYLFDCDQMKERGAIYFPDFDHHNYMGRMKPALCQDLGINYRDESSFESGQFYVDKRKCWRETMLALWYAEHSDYYFKHFYGDKECPHVAFRRLGSEYAMTTRGPGWEAGVCIVQHDFDGRPLFYHRCQDKWLLSGNAVRNQLPDETLHHSFVRELRGIWPGRMWHNPEPNGRELAAIRSLNGRRYLYRRLPHEAFKGDERVIELLPGGLIGEGRAECESRWEINEDKTDDGRPVMTLAICRSDRPTLIARPAGGGRWEGRWLEFEKCPVEMIPESAPTREESLSSLWVEIAGLCRRRGYIVEADTLRERMIDLLKGQQ